MICLGRHSRHRARAGKNAVGLPVTLRGPVPSDSGLGIGLYQVARHAEACGYSLVLAHNTDGKVSFVLSGPLKPADQPAAAAPNLAA
ncbi:MAG: hypothetical protein KBE22_05450 [Candidatus Accumulibacter sp.]|nr:hypothetical protein [Accumulibacter sp.]